jgi:hypothetical protein
MWPDVMKGVGEQFHALADILGEEHDLSVLKSVLEAEALARAEEVSAVAEAAGLRRAEKQREAKSLGARIFAERGGAFTKRLGHYWTAWKCQAAEVREEPAVEVRAANEEDAREAAPEAIVEAGVSEESAIAQASETSSANEAG